MDAFKLGPFLVPVARLLVILSLLGLGFASDWVARRAGQHLAVWGSNVGLVGLAVARIGFVMTHFSDFVREPLNILYVWQGGFDPTWGLLGGLAYTLWLFRHERYLIRLTLIPLAVAAGVWFGGNWVIKMAQGDSHQQIAELPALTLYRLEDGSAVSLAAFKGRPVAVNVWATWCPPCRREMPLLAEVARQTPGVEFLFADQGEGPQTIGAYLSGLKFMMGGAVLLDPQQAMSRTQKVVGLPTTFFYDAQGKLMSRQVGELSRAMLSAHLSRIR